MGNVNRLPVLNPIGSKTVNEGELLEFTITASDPDGDDLDYSAGNLPTGASFDPVTQAFSWIPDYDQAGNYPDVLFTVTDNGAPPESDSEAITITVEKAQPKSVDNLVSISVGRPSYDRRTGQFSVNVTVTNTSGTIISEPVWLIIEGISNPNVTLAAGDGITSDGKEYIDMSGLLGDGHLDIGESITLQVHFNNPNRVLFTFEPSVRGIILPDNGN